MIPKCQICRTPDENELISTFNFYLSTFYKSLSSKYCDDLVIL